MNTHILYKAVKITLVICPIAIRDKEELTRLGIGPIFPYLYPKTSTAAVGLGSFRNVEFKNTIDSFFKRLKRFGYTNCTITINDLIDRSDYELFEKVCSISHSLYHLLPS